MPSLDGRELLGVQSQSPRKSPSKQNLNGRRASSAMRGNSPLADAIGADEDVGGRHSLAHELAVALMPEPSAGSKLLAEEFGIEFDEGAEGIDEQPNGRATEDATSPSQDASFADELATDTNGHSLVLDLPDTRNDMDPSFNSPSIPPSPVARKLKPHRDQQDPMLTLSQDLEYTDNFLKNLQRLDTDASSSSSSQQPTLEQLASNIISRINESARDREQQVRELLSYEREFRKIANEVGGNDALGRLDELERVEDLGDKEKASSTVYSGSTGAASKRLSMVSEDPVGHAHHRRVTSRDWDQEDIDYDSDQPTPMKDTFPPPPTVVEPLTPAKTIPQLSHFRTCTASLVSSLTSISEQVQVNGAATSDAGRKIRALKNKLGGWQADWDNAERSRTRIERWEAGIPDSDDSPTGSISSIHREGTRRIDGRVIAEEHLRASQQSLAEATQRTQAIMAVS